MREGKEEGVPQENLKGSVLKGLRCAEVVGREKETERMKGADQGVRLEVRREPEFPMPISLFREVVLFSMQRWILLHLPR
jgi:hypothetical protein